MSFKGNFLLRRKFFSLRRFLIHNEFFHLEEVFSILLLWKTCFLLRGLFSIKSTNWFLLQINFEEIIVLPTFNATSLNISDAFNLTDALNITEVDIRFSQPVESAPVYLFCCALSLAAISAFLRAGFVLKFIVMICCIAAQGCVLSFSQLYAFYDHQTVETRFEILYFILYSISSKTRLKLNFFFFCFYCAT